MAFMVYIGKDKDGKQIFVNPNNVLAVIDSGAGKEPTEILMVGNTTIIVDKSWSWINSELGRAIR